MTSADTAPTRQDPTVRGTPHRLARAFHEAEVNGLKQTAIARAIALAIILAWLFVLVGWAAAFYVPHFVVFAAIATVHYSLARGDRARDWHGYVAFTLDAALLTFTLLYPNPLIDRDWPLPVYFRFGNLNYFFVLLALVALSYSPRLMVWTGAISVVCWSAAAWLVATLPQTLTDIPSYAQSQARLERFMDPQFLSIELRAQETVVILVVTGILAFGVARSRRLALRVATSERARTNLARYFPPNIVDELAGADNPFGDVRSQSLAVLFADIVGFTHMAEQVSPREIVEMLRAFHRRTERIVFENSGTLDKFLGDGVMATFGTPRESAEDAGNALACARALVEEVDEWNKLRAAAGYPTVRLSIGIHFGPVVRGDIGTERRLEYAVLGDTVNVASRLEELTRDLGCTVVVSDPLVAQLRASGDVRAGALLAGFAKSAPQRLRGREALTEVWAWSADTAVTGSNAP